MARIEWVKHRLNNWALWKSRESAGGLGFSGQSSWLAIRQANRYRESVVPVDDVDASTTDVAVESLRYTKEHLYRTLQLVYVKGVGHREAARTMGRAESTIKANLEHADQALREWFNAKAERDAMHRKAYLQKCTLTT